MPWVRPWHEAVAGRGDRHSDGSVCLGSVFGDFPFVLLGSGFLASSLYCVRGLFLCLPVGVPLVGYCSFRSPGCLDLCPRTQTLVGRGQSRSCRGGTFGCTMLSSSEYHGEATQKGSLNTENGPRVRAGAEFV